MISVISPNYGKVKVIFYENVRNELGKNRVAKVTAILRMESERRGRIESAFVETSDAFIVPENIQYLTDELIGKRKNLSSCYDVEAIID